MTNCKQGDVVLVPFPFTDLTMVKRRPALVLSANWFNTSREDCIVAAITSQIPSELQPDEYRLSASDLGAGGLPKPSLVRLGKLVTISKSLLRERLGTLSEATVVAVLERMELVFHEQVDAW
jgi:mRNA interferase MazF